MAKTDTTVAEKIKITIKEPSNYNIIFHNDDKTSFEFVISVLVTIFSHSEEEATVIAVDIHNNGYGIVGNFTYEIAEQKKADVIKIARSHGYPLQVSVEKS